MPITVGDKGLTFAAGSVYATFTPVSTPAVGDKVILYNLGNGQRLAVPSLNFSLSDYTFVVPSFQFAGFNFHLDFNFNLLSFKYGTPISAGTYLWDQTTFSRPSAAGHPNWWGFVYLDLSRVAHPVSLTIHNAVWPYGPEERTENFIIYKNSDWTGPIITGIVHWKITENPYDADKYYGDIDYTILTYDFTGLTGEITAYLEIFYPDRCEPWPYAQDIEIVGFPAGMKTAMPFIPYQGGVGSIPFGQWTYIDQGA